MLKFASIRGDGRYFILVKCVRKVRFSRWILSLYPDAATRDTAFARLASEGCCTWCERRHEIGELNASIW